MSTAGGVKSSRGGTGEMHDPMSRSYGVTARIRYGTKRSRGGNGREIHFSVTLVIERDSPNPSQNKTARLFDDFLLQKNYFYSH